MTRPLGQLALLPILRARLAYPAVRLWESLSCLFVRCGWWCRHPGVRDRRLPRGAAAGRGGGAVTERITFDGDMDHLDEVVMHGTVHIEALDAHGFMIAIATADGRLLHLHGLDVAYSWHDGDLDGLFRLDPPLLGCGVEWVRGLLRHRCYEDKGHEHRHRCDCGSAQRLPAALEAVSVPKPAPAPDRATAAHGAPQRAQIEETP